MKVTKLFLLSTFAAAFSFAGIITYNATLNGPGESPRMLRPALGGATVTIDDILHTMRVQVTFTGLTSGDTASHIHSATAVPLTGTAGGGGARAPLGGFGEEPLPTFTI